MLGVKFGAGFEEANAAVPAKDAVVIAGGTDFFGFGETTQGFFDERQQNMGGAAGVELGFGAALEEKARVVIAVVRIAQGLKNGLSFGVAVGGRARELIGDGETEHAPRELMIGIDGLFGNPVKTVRFNIDDIFSFVDPAVIRAAILRLREGKEASPAHLVLTFFHAAGTLLFAWVYLATCAKRLHDRDKSGWWAIPFLVVPGLYAQFVDRLPNSYAMLPFALIVFALMIWGFIEIYCLKGTRWTNRFGPNTLPKEQTRARSGSRSSYA